MIDTSNPHATLSTPVDAVVAEKISMVYGGRCVLDDVSLTVTRGQTLAILGPNGAGKSTLIEVLEGFRSPSAGVAVVLGHDPVHAPEIWRSRIGVVLQSWRDHGTWRVRDLLRYVAASHRSVGRSTWDIDDLLGRVGLGDHAAQRVRTLSGGGQRRRVDVALALVGRPDLIFLDEPTTGFDPQVRRDFHDLIRELAAETTIVWATHDLAEAESMCDRIVILAGGVVVADGSPSELRSTLGNHSVVSWRDENGEHTEKYNHPEEFVRRLLAGPGDVVDLEIRRRSLEDIYLSIVESAADADAADTPSTEKVGATR